MTAPSVPTGNTYDKYGSRNPIERRLMAGFLTRLERALPARPPRRVLEVGAGEGEIARRVRARYPDAGITLLDLPDPELQGDWQGHGLAGTFGDIAALPFATDAFDLVLVIEVLEHVPDPECALTEIARVCCGRAILSVPREPVWRAANLARGKYWSAGGNTPGHVQHWGRAAFRRLVARHLEITSVSSPFPWTIVGARSRSDG